MSSLVRAMLLRWKHEPKGTSVLPLGDVAHILLTALKDVSTFAPVPCLKDAAGLALDVLHMMQVTKDNKDTFMRLAEDACRIICAAYNAFEDATPNGDRTQQMLCHDMEQLCDTLRSIVDFAKERASRNLCLRFFRHRSDADKIQEFQETIRGSLALFGLQSNIRMRVSMSQMSVKLDNIIAGRARASAQEAGAAAICEQGVDLGTDTKETSVNLSEVSAVKGQEQPGQNHERRTLEGLPAAGKKGILHGAIPNVTTMIITGNYNVSNVSHNTSSTNSGHTTTITTSNSNNKICSSWEVGPRCDLRKPVLAPHAQRLGTKSHAVYPPLPLHTARD